ncbi:hypothetical protein LAZ67_X002360 [Cordylochernes scorpioides]|uniref:Gag protein n=1 Tax=Cordylochernes scorpioides TaxID=51811 RepID=A0ABY6LUE1_9ARAC|nr:hypothetical protein LAZ67_X002360 [Cordylochernes scorpioides]
MANYIQVAAPEGFNFGKPNEWPIWFKRFQRYRIASELSEKSESEQVNALIYIMGDKAEEILILFNLSEAQINDYKLVVSKFQDYFIGKRNVIYERAKFNRRSQGEMEPVEEFITNLYVLAETCSYGILKEEMIRDRLLESELTLEKAIQIVRQSESVKNQQKEIRQDTENRNVDVINRKGGRNGTNFQKTRMKGTKTYNSNFPKNLQGCSSYEKRKCFRCGYYQGHSKEQCPAKDAICNKCRKKGHFAKDSEAKPKGAGVRELPPLEVDDRVWLTDLNGEPYVNYPEANPHTSDAAADVAGSSTSPGRTVRPPRRFGED